MLACLVYLVSLGKTGLEQVATQNFQKAHYLKEALRQIPGYKILNSKPTYNEFTIECPNVDLLSQKCKEANILPPLRLSRYYPERTNQLLVCVTENNSKTDLTQFIRIAKEAGI
jgi:glycine dehydrogenase subunit 1